MTDKAYIVANEQQEQEVLEKFGREGLVWISGREATEWKPQFIPQYPYTLINGGEISWKFLSQLKNEEIVYDGRKESKMKISKEVYDALVEWRDANHLDHTHINGGDLLRLPTFILNFWLELGISQNEANNRLIAIIRWLNGEDVFEVEKPKKWVVRSKDSDDGCHSYIEIDGFVVFSWYSIKSATKFDTKEEAESWANSHQEVIEVEE